MGEGQVLTPVERLRHEVEGWDYYRLTMEAVEGGEVLTVEDVAFTALLHSTGIGSRTPKLVRFLEGRDVPYRFLLQVYVGENEVEPLEALQEVLAGQARGEEWREDFLEDLGKLVALKRLLVEFLGLPQESEYLPLHTLEAALRKHEDSR